MTADGPALATLYTQHYGRILRLCYALTQDWTVAEDLAADTFMRALTHAVPADYTYFWLATIARNLVRDRARRAAVWRWVAWHPGLDGRIDSGTPERALLAAEARAEAARRWAAALGTLPAGDQALIRGLLAGVPTGEIGRALGLGPAAIKARLWRAKQRLRAAHGE
jgi:RNA polymerase sigma-70 factor (ECF subfamily)